MCDVLSVFVCTPSVHQPPRCGACLCVCDLLSVFVCTASVRDDVDDYDVGDDYDVCVCYLCVWFLSACVCVCV